MNVQVVCTRSCSHRPNLERELQDLGVPYEVVFIEEAPELAERLGIRHSPNIVVDGRLMYSGQPTESELRRLVAESGAGS
ncbi:glutaredoxin family protein [Thiohalobacter sp.]|uniref:glutaredoxin family protein n=1 Tax=Thiohalobacter sp. TaxID=2025948 RepID=UPI00262801CF|nr:thioredoxin family protein [Thiohalobacter sp.]